MKLSSTLTKALTAFVLLLVALATTLVIQSSPSSAAPVGSPVTVTVSKRWFGDPAGATSTVSVSNAIAPPTTGQVTNDSGTEDDVVITSYVTTAGALMLLTETMSSGAGSAAGQMLECTEGGDPSVYRYVMGDVAGNPDARSIFIDLPFNPAGNGVISCVLLDSTADPNPDLSVRCGINVTLVIDESNSIGTAGAEDNIRNAVRAMVDGLSGTGSALRIVEFGTRARQASIAGSTGFQMVDATLGGAIETYLTTPGQNIANTSYDPANQPEGGDGFTNWQGALALAGGAPGGGDLTVFITDGEPNTTNASADAGRAGFLRPPEAAAAAIDDLDNVKQSAHVLGIGVGNFSTNPASFSMLRNVVEPNGAIVWTGTGALDAQTTDVVGVSDYSALPGVIRSALLPLCAPTVEITKVDDAGQPVEGVEFSGSVDVTNPLPSDPDVYTWADPDLGSTADDGTGNDAPRVKSTPADGTVTYSWVPDTNGDLDDWTSEFRFAEQVPAGWEFNPSGSNCTLSRPGQPADAPLALLSSVGGSQVDFSLLDDLAQPFLIRAGDHIACTIQNDPPGDPEISVAKQADAVEQVDATHFQARYTVTVTNDGDGDGTYSLTETPAFGVGATIDRIIVQSAEPATDISLSTPSVVIATDEPIAEGATHTYAVTINFTVAPAMAPAAKACDPGGAPGSGAFNRAVLTFDGTDTNADACLPIPSASVSVAKRVAGVERVDADTLSVTYEIDVRNAAGNVATLYDLDDEFSFGTGISIVAGTATATAGTGVPAGTTIDPTFTGVAPNTRVVSGIAIAGGETHTYEVAVTVDLDLDDPATLDGACNTAETTNDALTNRVTASSNGVTTDDLACAGFSTLRLIKTVSNVNGGTATADDFTLTATSGAVALTGDGQAAGVVPAGPYTLAESGPSGYVTTGWTCDNLTVTNDVVNVATGTNVVCRITNSDQPTLELVKTAPANATLVSGSTYSVDYLLIVRNTGTTPQAFTLTDSLADLAAGLTVVPSQLAVTASAGAPAPSATWNGTTDTTVAMGTIPGTEAFTYNVHVEFTVDAATLTAPTCGAVPTPGNGAFNSATLSYRSITIDAAACSNVPGPTITVEKTAGTVAFQTGNAFTASYTVTVRNNGQGPGTYTLDDSPMFLAGATVTSIAASGGPLAAPVVGTTPFTSLRIATDQSIVSGGVHTYTVVVGFTVDPATPAGPRECAAPIAPGSGAFNRATVTVAGSASNADACISIPAPALGVSKTPGTLTNTPAGSDSYMATYTITVFNNGEAPGSYSLTDAPMLGSGIEVTAITVTGATLPAPVNASAPFSSVDIVDGQEIGLDPHTYSVTVTFTLDPAAVPDVRTCATPATPNRGALNRATMTPAGGTAIDADACLNIPGSTVTMQKQAGTITYSAASNMYTATYSIVVRNTGQAAGQYTLVDRPVFGDGATISEVRVTSTAPAVDVTAAAPIDTVGVVTDQPIAGNGEHIFAVSVDFTVLPGMAADERDCSTPAAPGSGAFNRATISVGGTTTDSDACLDIPQPDLTVVKDQPAIQVLGGFQFVATYRVVVENDGDGPGEYTLVDQPEFGTGATINEVRVTDEPGDAPSVDAVDDQAPFELQVVTDQAINANSVHTFLVEVRFSVTPGMAPDARECDAAGSPGSGAYNGVTIRTGAIGIDDDHTCVDIPAGDVEVTKVVDQVAIVQHDRIEVSYLVTVRNTTDVATEYDLTDQFVFDDGNTIVDVDAVGVSPAGLVVDPTFTGQPNGTTLASDVAIDGDVVHTYRVTAWVAVDLTDADPDGDCVTGQNGGLLNRATAVTVNGPRTAIACAEFSTLELRKTVVNDNGGLADADDFTLFARGAVLNVSGTTGVRSLVAAGDYALSESGPAGYTAGSWSCVGGDVAAATVAVAAGADVVCAIVNDDDAVDLELTKTDDGVTAVAGGDPFEYTLTVRNVGTRDADLGEPVTVTDRLPAGLTWVEPAPAGCAFAGQTMTCGLDPALLGVGDPAVEIVASVRAAADVTDDVLVNQAWVTTDDDPVCAPQGCIPPPCPDIPNNNVDCEETPIERRGAVEIVKTDSVADGQNVRPGDSYSYTLQVRNLGPATIFPGLVVNDDLPAELSLISAVGGAGWTCNGVDPVACTYAPALAPNESAPAITVTVRVNFGVNVDEIHNVATTIGTIDDDDCPSTLAQAPCVVTDDDDETTPVESDADLAIVKTSNTGTSAPGNAVRWQLAIVNNGPSTAVNVVVTDVVPASMTVIGVTSPEFSCSRTGNSVSCTVASLVPGGRGTVFIDSVVNTGTPAGTITNIGRFTSDTPDPNPSNNSDDALVVINQQQPPQPPTTTTPPEPPVRQPLPQTGAAMTVEMLQAALVLVFIGGLVLAATRRRPNHDRPTT